MPFQRRKFKTRRPRRRQSRRLGLPPVVARVSFHPGSTDFPVQAFGNPFQGYESVVGFNHLLPATGPQNRLEADSRLVFLRFVLPPNDSKVPLGVDVLVKGFPNTASQGTMVGRTSRFLSKTTSTVVNCRLPPAVTQYWIESPFTESQAYIVFRFRYYADAPTTAAILPFVTVEMRFQQQPLETVILR